MSLCPRCREPALWVLLPSGKRMLVGTQRDATGTIAVTRDAAGTVHGRHVSKAEPVMRHEHLHRAHVADCKPPQPVALPAGVADFQAAKAKRDGRGRPTQQPRPRPSL